MHSSLRLCARAKTAHYSQCFSFRVSQFRSFIQRASCTASAATSSPPNIGAGGSFTSGSKGPIYFFVAVAFWNLVGAGLFAFLINPPIALYYMQGLNLTPVHGHTAFFGVYGMLGLGLTLFCLRALKSGRTWKDGTLKASFWLVNFGLVFMVLLSMLPVGLLQAWASIQHGTWYARFAEFMQSPTMVALRWMRIPGDILFVLGAALFGWFILGLLTGHSYSDKTPATGLEASFETREQGDLTAAGR